MIRDARARGFKPWCVAFDGRYGSPDNLTSVGSLGWAWLTRLESNRPVEQDRRGTGAASATAIAAAGTEAWLPGFGLVKVFGTVAPSGDTAYWATDDLAMTGLERVRVADCGWAIEHYHRGVKQCTASSGASAARRGRSATTSGWRSGVPGVGGPLLRSGGVGWRRRGQSFATPSGHTSSNPIFLSHKGLQRKPNFTDVEMHRSSDSGH